MQNSTGAFYNRISFLYPFINFFLKKHRKTLIKEVNGAPIGKLLEIGIGQGSHLPLYRGHQVIGIDISEVMLEKAQRFKRCNMELLQMNGEELTFPSDYFDHVVMCHVLAVTKNPDKLLDEVYRVLKPGGQMFILNHFTPYNWLKYLDKAFQPISSFFHFKSSFYQHQIKGLKQFSLHKQTELGIGSYFKLLIYCKP